MGIIKCLLFKLTLSSPSGQAVIIIHSPNLKSSKLSGTSCHLR